MSTGFTCPRCQRTSYHPQDLASGYCAACEEFTGVPATDNDYAVRTICRKMITSTWPSAPRGLVESGVDCILPTVRQALATNAFDMHASDLAGTALRGLFVGYPVVSPFSS